MFKAAPLSKLSETTHMFKALLLELSFLILDIKVKWSPSASKGVIYPPSLGSSTTLHPGAFLSISLIVSKSYSFSNSTFTDSEWEVFTGTLTQVAV